MSTTKIEAPKEVEEFALPSGVVVRMRQATGRDLHDAMKSSKQDTDYIPPALAAVLCTFDGEAKNMDDIMDMPLTDYSVLLQKVGEAMGN